VTARLLAALASVVLVASACTDDGPATPEPTVRETPGDPASTWAPDVPAEPVDEAAVRAAYDPVLDAATSAVDSDSGPGWSSSTLRTEELEGTCAVTLERAAEGAVPPLGDDTPELTALSAAVADGGFGELVTADDPGGALRYLAHDDQEALFELRSKDTTTVAVRVPTTPESCAG
jgi:hypothetical protein